MKKTFLILAAAVVLSSVAFAEKSGRYVNSKEGLNIRAEPNAGTGGEVLGTIEGGTLLEALEEGKKATIDGYTSAWVKVRAVNSERFVDGGDFTQTGWVFGAYLE